MYVDTKTTLYLSTSIAGSSNGATKVASIIKIPKLSHCHCSIGAFGLTILIICIEGHQSLHTDIKTVVSQNANNTLI